MRTAPVVLRRVDVTFPDFAVEPPTMVETVWLWVRLPCAVLTFLFLCLAWSAVITILLPPGLSGLAFILGMPGGSFSLITAQWVYDR